MGNFNIIFPSMVEEEIVIADTGSESDLSAQLWTGKVHCKLVGNQLQVQSQKKTSKTNLFPKACEIKLQ